MARLIKCDGDCGKISPHEGKYIANSWIYIHTSRIGAGGFKKNDQFVVCEECWKKMTMVFTREATIA